MAVEPGSGIVIYGVWIEGAGWLKHTATGRVFGSDLRPVAETAAELWGPGARVLPCDPSLTEIEPQFLAQQAAQRERDAREAARQEYEQAERQRRFLESVQAAEAAKRKRWGWLSGLLG